MKNLTRILVLFTLLFSNVITAQKSDTIGPVGLNTFFIDYANPQEYTLGPIRVEGADNFDHNAIKLLAGLKQGHTLMIPGDKITTAINNLWEEGIFSNVEIAVEKEIAGVVYLVIKLTPRPKLSKFKFVGVNRREADKIREEISLYTGKTITENLIFATENKIRGYFREKGFYTVQVNINRVVDTLINNSEIFMINVNKGDRVRIDDLNIEGNTSIKDWKLKMAMKDTKEKTFWRFWKSSKFTESAYQRDKEAVLNKFGKIGLRDASIKHDTVYLSDGSNLNINIEIEEGDIYYFGNINWVGNTKFRATFLDTVIGIKYGDIYNKELLDQRLNMSMDGSDVSSLYMDRGYLFFQVIPVEVSVIDKHINYEMRIMEGKQARIRNIIIKGNTKTSDHVIRREIRTKPGDLFNRNDIIRTQRELSQLGYFNDQAFQVNPIPNPADGTVDIEYTVEEKSSDQIELSGGYGGVGQNGRGTLIGTVGLTFNNFSSKKLFKFKKEYWNPLPGGDGQRLALRGQTNGKFYQSYNFSFTEPWLGGKKPTSLFFQLAHNLYSPTGSVSTSSIRTSTVALGLGKRNKWPDNYFQTNFQLSYTYYDVRNFTGQFVFTDGFANDFSLMYVLSRTSIDAPIYPTSGSNIKFMAKATLPYSAWDGIDDYSSLSEQERYKYLEYYKLKFTGEWYVPLTSDKKLVFTPRFGLGFMGAYNYNKGLTPFDRFYLGGSGLTGVSQFGGREIIASRGYEQGMNAPGGDPLVAKYAVELRYPISLNPSATFFVIGFAEGVNSYPSFREFNPFNVKRCAGVGIRVFLPMFGMLGLDYGFGFDRLDTWSDGYGTSPNEIDIMQKGWHGQLNFTIGGTLGEL